MGTKRKVTGGKVGRVTRVGDDGLVLGKKNSLLQTKREGVRCRYATASFLLQSSVRSLRKFSRSLCKTSQQYAELTLWPVRSNHLRIKHLMLKKMMSMLFTCLALLSVLNRACHSNTCVFSFSQSLPGSPLQILRDFNTILYSLAVRFIEKSQ
jgi:hypothetical protein